MTQGKRKYTPYGMPDEDDDAPKEMRAPDTPEDVIM